MIKFFLILFVVLLFPVVSDATEQKTEKIVTTIIMGSQITQFDVTAGPKPKIKTVNNKGLNQEKVLSQANFKSLLNSFKNLRVSSKNNMNQCDRTRIAVQYIDAQGKSQLKESCFGIKAGFSKDYHNYSNRLVDVM